MKQLSLLLLFLSFSLSLNAQRVSDLPSAGALTGAELLPVVQGGLTKKTTTQTISNLYRPDSTIWAKRRYVDSVILRDSLYQLTFAGNSLVAGYGGSGINQSLINRLGSKYSVTNNGVNGWTIDSMLNNFTATVTNTKDPERRNILVGLEGANSMQSNGVPGNGYTGLQYYLKVKQYCQQAQAQGFDVFWVTSLPSDFHLERNPFRIEANELFLDSFEQYYNIHVVNMGTTVVGKFGSNHIHTGSTHVDPVRSSSNLAYYSDKTHLTAKGADVVATTIADKVLNITSSSAMSDREDYLKLSRTNGQYIIWGSKTSNTYDTLLGVPTCNSAPGTQGSRALSTQIIPVTTGTKPSGRIEFISQQSNVWVGVILTSVGDSARLTEDWDIALSMNSNGKLSLLSYDDPIVVDFGAWTPGDKIALQFEPMAVKVYVEDTLIYKESACDTCYFTSFSFPYRVAYASSVALAGLREIKVQTSGLTKYEVAYGADGSIKSSPKFTYDDVNNNINIATTNANNTVTGAAQITIGAANVNDGSGSFNTIIGTSNNISGGNSNSIIGHQITIAGGTHNTGFGRQHTFGSSGLYKTAIGKSHDLTGGDFGATALCWTNKSQGIATLATGWVTISTGLAAFSSGHFTGARGYASFAGGTTDTANGEYSNALGGFSNANGYYSSVNGLNLRSMSVAEHSVGANGLRYAPTDAATWRLGERLVQVGNGVDGNNLSNALTLWKSGHFQFGTTTHAQTDSLGFRVMNMPVTIDTLAGAGSAPVFANASGKLYRGTAGGTVSWGSLIGTLSDQTDLQAALDAKQGNITLTTTGTSGAATLIGNTLNIPQYSGGGGGISGSGTANKVSMWSASTTLTDAPITISGTDVGINKTPTVPLDVNGQINASSTLQAGTNIKLDNGLYGLTFAVSATGQTTIGSSAYIPTSLFSVSTTDYGSLPVPRVTQAQRNAIVSPDANILVQNTTNKAIERYDGVSWNAVNAPNYVVKLHNDSTSSTSFADVPELDITLDPNSSYEIEWVVVAASGTTTEDMYFQWAGAGAANMYYFTWKADMAYTNSSNNISNYWVAGYPGATEPSFVDFPASELPKMGTIKAMCHTDGTGGLLKLQYKSVGGAEVKIRKGTHVKYRKLN